MSLFLQWLGGLSVDFISELRDHSVQQQQQPRSFGSK
jgi:hypothetical protein